MSKYTRYQDTPKFIRGANYRVDLPWDYFPISFMRYVKDGLDVNPNFQRGYIWTVEQKIKYIEFCVKGGNGSREIYTNCYGWGKGERGFYVLVDGKQRVDAVLGYLSNEFPIFEDCFHEDFKDSLDTFACRFSWHVNELRTIEEIYEWYLDLNTGGTVHSENELQKVKELLLNKVQYDQPSKEELDKNAGIHRRILVEAKLELEETELKRQSYPKGVGMSKYTRRKK